MRGVGLCRASADQRRSSRYRPHAYSFGDQQDSSDPPHDPYAVAGLPDACRAMRAARGPSRFGARQPQRPPARRGKPREGHGADRGHGKPDRLGAAELRRAIEGRRELGRVAPDRGRFRLVGAG
ncbi:hypothetical protein QU38_01135, partial [Staphylococcus aureus]